MFSRTIRQSLTHAQRRVASSHARRTVSSNAVPQANRASFAAVGVAAAAIGGGVAAYHFSQNDEGFFSRFRKLDAVSVNCDDASPKGPLDPQAFVSFKLREVYPINHNTKLFRFALPDRNSSLGLPVASCVVTRATIEGEEKPVIRPYTPTSPKGAKGYFDLIVKDYPTGVMSTHITNLKPGDSLDVKGPFVKYEYKPNTKKYIGMVAGGTGITPMLQVIEEVLSNPEDKTHISLVFANQSPDDIILKEKLDALSANHTNFTVEYTVDKPTEHWVGKTGYVTKKIVHDRFAAPGPETMIMVCGPPPMMKAVSGPKGENFTQGDVGGVLAASGYDSTMVYKF